MIDAWLEQDVIDVDDSFFSAQAEKRSFAAFKSAIEKNSLLEEEVYGNFVDEWEAFVFLLSYDREQTLDDPVAAFVGFLKHRWSKV